MLSNFLLDLYGGNTMDRLQQKTKAAFFNAFRSLLEKKSFSHITVQEILDLANIGRSTFYAHFQTKDELLKYVCEELFGHIVSSAKEKSHLHGFYSEKETSQSIFCHLLYHLQENDSNILGLLSCENSDIFLRYFKNSLKELIQIEIVDQNQSQLHDIPSDFLVNHISGSFVEMVLWWIQNKQKQTPEELDGYFRAVIEPILNSPHL